MSRPTSLLAATALFTGVCAADQLATLPISFEPNQGQTHPRIQYLARSGNMLVFLTADGYTLSTASQSVSMQIAGAEGLSNYYMSGRTITGVPHFERVRAQRIRHNASSAGRGSVARTGALLIGDQTVTVTQSAGPFGYPTRYTTSLFAGGGTIDTPLLGDGGPASSAYIHFPIGLALNGSTLYIADWGHHRIRAVTADGRINTVAGGGSSLADDVAPTDAQIVELSGLAFDQTGG